MWVADSSLGIVYLSFNSEFQCTDTPFGMNPYRYFALWFSFLIALAVTGGVYYFEKTTRTEQGTQMGLEWSRQWSQQLELLAETAKRLRLEKPHQWAIQEFRRKNPVSSDRKIYLVSLKTLKWKNKEEYRYDYWSGEFDYLKQSEFDASQAYRVLVKIPYQGFLGAASPSLSWIYAAVFFLVVMSYFYLLTLRAPRYDSPSDQLKKEIVRWNQEAQQTLTDLSYYLNQLSLEIDSLTSSRIETQNTLESVAQSLNPMVSQYKSIALSLKDFSAGFVEVKKISRQFEIQAQGFGEDGKILTGTASELRKKIDTLIRMNHTTQNHLIQLIKAAAQWKKTLPEPTFESSSVKQEKVHEEIRKLSHSFEVRKKQLKKIVKQVKKAS